VTINRRIVVVTAIVAGLGTLGLGLWVAGDQAPNAADTGLLDAITAAFARQHALLELVVQPTEPYVLIPLIAVMAVCCAGQRRWDGLLLCLSATTVPIALNSWVLKPLFDRRLKDYLAYPSGHTVSLVATLTVLALLARPGPARRLVIAVATVVTSTAGIALVGLGYHYPIDVAGGACFALSAVLSLSILLAWRPGRARSGGSPHAGTSSGSPPAASPR
jgi:membrane-associated phospholipid phosphatase